MTLENQIAADLVRILIGLPVSCISGVVSVGSSNASSLSLSVVNDGGLSSEKQRRRLLSQPVVVRL